jgi:hypothetical protein
MIQDVDGQVEIVEDSSCSGSSSESESPMKKPNHGTQISTTGSSAKESKLHLKYLKYRNETWEAEIAKYRRRRSRPRPMLLAIFDPPKAWEGNI